ncbi:glycosyltransferase [Haematospirillum sp. 15-248]|uniref:glycosyltransferase family 4 protein n=1 Tax=Haematospirillum sp. 15-248 TaxID=2723107 RepID=UPI00143BC8C0|nr:glycosyltransferase family 4 protein [Haematospirillum sp. 15-248]NKD88704.1 glycosyltransferase [Haematospirillum sp. 15-248]
MSKPLFKLLVIGSLYPHSAHSVRAANIVIFELLRALARKADCRVGYLLVRRAADPDPTETELAGLTELECVGVEVLTPIQIPTGAEPRSTWLKLLSVRRSDFYPDSIHGDLVYSVVRQYCPDMCIVPWSEWLTALCADFPIKKFAYYGNPDHKAGAWRLAFDRRHGISGLSRFRSKIGLRFLEKEHFKVMSCYDLLGNVAANDAAYYADKGHPNAFYIQNLWIDRFSDSWQERRQAEVDASKPIKIIANVGQLGATANRYGLEMLGGSIAPMLRERMRGLRYELHVLGRGDLSPSLARQLASPEIVIRGFVDDIDEEMFESAVFLCLNNASPFKVCHTRYLHAWSLGMCVVAHRDVVLSMPEMQNRVNCLLGTDASDIAALVHDAVVQKDLRDRIGAGGYATFRHYFTAEAVSERIWGSIDKMIE